MLRRGHVPTHARATPRAARLALGSRPRAPKELGLRPTEGARGRLVFCDARESAYPVPFFHALSGGAGVIDQIELKNSKK